MQYLASSTFLESQLKHIQCIGINYGAKYVKPLKGFNENKSQCEIQHTKMYLKKNSSNFCYTEIRPRQPYLVAVERGYVALEREYVAEEGPSVEHIHSYDLPSNFQERREAVCRRVPDTPGLTNIKLQSKANSFKKLEVQAQFRGKVNIKQIIRGIQFARILQSILS